MSDEWYTPHWVFKELNVTFDVDVCAPVGGTGIVPAPKHYSIDDDGLSQDWDGFVWMNPPYSKPTPWIDKFLAHNNGIALVPFSKSKWFVNLWNNDNVSMIALPPNLKFVRPDGSSKQIFMQCVLVGVGEKALSALQQCSINKVR